MRDAERQPTPTFRVQSWISLLLTGPLLLVSTACTIAHYPFTQSDPITLDRPLAQNGIISFNLHGYSPARAEQLGFTRPIQEGLVGDSAFREAVLVTEIPTTGLFISVDFDRRYTRIGPSLEAAYILLCILTAHAIPYYGDRPGGPQLPPWHWTSTVDIAYTLSVNGVQKGTYRYSTNEKVFQWLLAPLAYPFLVDKQKKSVILTTTARQFLRDAQRDGHW